MDDLLQMVDGEDVGYTEMLRYSLARLRSFPENDVIDIYVVAGRRFAKAVSDFAPNSVKIIQWEVDTSRCSSGDGACIGVLSSMRKTKIFEIIPDMDKYEAVLFLDAGIAITGPLEPIFLKVIEDTARLHIKSDDYAPGNLTEAHSLKFWSHEDYTEEEMSKLVTSAVPVFNAGQFAFVPSPTFKNHFLALNEAILQHEGKKAFYEQSHMNKYFNLRNLTVTTLNLFVNFNEYLIPDPATGKSPPLLIHVPNNFLSFIEKLNKMKAAWRVFLETSNKPIQHSTRYILHETISASTIIEVGVFKGNFSAYLLTHFNPSKLYLIDPWESGQISSGDADGNNIESYSGEELHQNVRKQFAERNKVVVMRKFSQILEDPYTFDNCTIDLVYLDGNRTEEGVLKDLKASVRLLKPGTGWLTGHDFQCVRQESKVKQTVMEFCTDYGFRIRHLFEDGCSSFAISV
jgi:hypothetical protein